MKKLSLALLLVLLLTLAAQTSKAQAATVPTFTIQGVTKDVKVTILTSNFPANKEFRENQVLSVSADPVLLPG